MTFGEKFDRKYKSKTEYWCTRPPIEVYSAVMSGELKKFPGNYMTKEVAKILVRYIILDKLNFTREDICKKFNFELLSKHNLGGTKRKFDYCIYNAIKYIFNEYNIMEWELNKTPIGFWKVKENRIRFILWVVKKEKIDVNKLEDVRKINAKLIDKYGGHRLLQEGDGVYSIIVQSFNITYKEWEFNKINVWTEEKILKALKWLFEERLKWSREDIVNNLSAKTFYDNCLGGMLCKFFGNSPFKALDYYYPNQYVKKDLKRGEKNRASLEVIRRNKQIKMTCN